MVEREAISPPVGEIEDSLLRVKDEERSGRDLEAGGDLLNKESEETAKDDVGGQAGAHFGEKALIIQFCAVESAVNPGLDTPPQRVKGHSDG